MLAVAPRIGEALVTEKNLAIGSARDEVVLEKILISHMLSNLLSNAVKYLPDGALVRLAVKFNQNQVNMVVSVNGIGIPEQERERILEAFL